MEKKESEQERFLSLLAHNPERISSLAFSNASVGEL
jgi:hypothetical protein